VGYTDAAYKVISHEHVPAWKQGHRLRTKVGPDEAAKLLDGVGRNADTVLEGTIRGLGRLLVALSGVVVAPAVVWATQPLFFGDAIRQGGAAVRAALCDQAELAGVAAVERQVFAEQCDGQDRLDTAGDYPAVFQVRRA